MTTTSKSSVILTPSNNPQSNRSKNSIFNKDSILNKYCQNENPNNKVNSGLKGLNSPLLKSGFKLTKSGSKNTNPNGSSVLVKNRMRERKFVAVKRSKRGDGLKKAVNLSCKCSKGNGKLIKCLCVAYEKLMASHKEFFKNGGWLGVENDLDQVGDVDSLGSGEVGDVKNEGLIRNAGHREGVEGGLEEEFLKNGGVVCAENEFDRVSQSNSGEVGNEYNDGVIQNAGLGEGCKEKVEEYGNVPETGEEGIQMSLSAVKRRRDKLLEEARESVPEPGSGRVMHLVKAFEKMMMMSKLKWNISDEKDDESKGVKKWALPGLHDPPETQLSPSSFCPSELCLSSECLGLDSRGSSSLNSNGGRNSSEPSGAFARRKWRKRQQLKTTAKPFKLRTEERGKCKKEEFMKKVQQMKEEEEKLRLPIAQSLPWTTDKPECLAKPPVKEATIPIDLVLHSDVRAEVRAEFDQQVAEKMSLVEQHRMEMDRQQKLAEEEEIRRLRKELIPKAQPMPYFNRPFVPRMSEKQPTLPKEPKFHIPQHKKVKSIQQSWSDTCSYISTSDVSCL